MKLLVWCVLFTVVAADPDPNLISLVTAPFRYAGRWLFGGNSHDNYYNHDRYDDYHRNYYKDDWHYYKKRSLDIESTDAHQSEPGDDINPEIAEPRVSIPLAYSGIHVMKKRSTDSLNDDGIPEIPVFPSPYASVFIHEDNLVHDSYYPFNYYVNNLKYDFKRQAEELREY